MLVTILLALILLWIAAGGLMLHLGSRPAGADYRRGTRRRVVAVSDSVPVEVQLMPPVEPRLGEDCDVVLVLDRSSSMGTGPGSPLQEAIRAAENFVLRCPDSIRVGLIVFDHDAQQLCPIEADHRKVLRALRSIATGGSTDIAAALDRAREACQAGRPAKRKTVIILSDGGSSRPEAEAAAQRLRESSVVPDIVAVGFGSAVDEQLLVAIAGSPDRYAQVSDIKELRSLFEFLAIVVAGQAALCGSVEESVRAPNPFILENAGGLPPTGLEQKNTTRIFWSIPVLGIKPIALTYSLLPECPGWHRVADPDSAATWRMPDSTTRRVQGPDGPRVLVLPAWLTWAWPVLNPLFFLLFGRFFCRSLSAPAAAELPEPVALPEPTLPEPLQAPAGRPFQWTARHALVIGLGEAGESILSSLKARLADRRIPAGVIDLLGVTTSHRANRAPIRIAGASLDPEQVAEVHLDFRPRLESLRRQGTPPMRAWIPFRDWLGSPQPLTTHSYAVAGDLRKARLALLSSSLPLEAKLAPILAGLREQDGLIFVVGRPEDPDYSGMLAEIAHICASAGGLGVSAVVVPGTKDQPAGVLALAKELERMIALRGDVVLSDRLDPPVAANKLFDRLIVLRGASGGRAPLSLAADFLWQVFSKRKLLPRLPDGGVGEGEVRACVIDLSGAELPAHSLWTWARDRFLAQAVNGRWLGLEIRDGHLDVPPVAEQSLRDGIERFWSGESFRRPHTLMLGFARNARSQGTTPSAAPLRGLIPIGLYHQQVEFRSREMGQFLAYLEEWCWQILAAEYDQHRCGLPILLESCVRIEAQLQQLADQLSCLPLSRNDTDYMHLAAVLYLDMARAVARLRSETARWMAALTGTRRHFDQDDASLPPTAVCEDLERGRQAAEAAMEVLPEAMAHRVKGLFDDWSRIHEADLLRQLRFVPSLDPTSSRLQLRFWLYGRALDSPVDLARHLRDAADAYAPEVLEWPLVSTLPVARVDDPAAWCRIGKEAGKVFPGCPTAIDEEDPNSAMALRIRELPLLEALGVAGRDFADPPYAWPEEANAARIAAKIRNSLRYEPRPLHPRLVQLVRNSEQLYALLMEIASGQVTETASETLLDRCGQAFPIAKSGQGLQLRLALDHFESLVRQVLVRRLSLTGLPLPEAQPAPPLDPEDAVRLVETNPIVQRCIVVPDWEVWRDLIRGLAVDAKVEVASSR